MKMITGKNLAEKISSIISRYNEILPFFLIFLKMIEFSINRKKSRLDKISLR